MSEPIPETGLPEDEYDPEMPPDPEPGPDPDTVEGWSEADVAGERVALFGSPIVAGTPGGARVEVAADGLHAYNTDNVETATISGESSVITGGEFSTAATNGTRIYLNNIARDHWPAVVFQTPGLYRSAAIAAYDGVHTESGVHPNGTLVMHSGRIAAGSEYSFFAAQPGVASMTGGSSGGGGFVQADSLGGAKMEGKLGNRVLAGAEGGTELQSSAGASVIADPLGNAQVEGKLGNRVIATSGGSTELQSSGGATVNATVGGGAELHSSGGALVAAVPSGAAQMTSSTGSIVSARADPQTVEIYAANVKRLEATTTGVSVTGAFTVDGVDVLAKIASLEARITALEA